MKTTHPLFLPLFIITFISLIFTGWEYIGDGNEIKARESLLHGVAMLVVVAVIFLVIELEREKRRNRILQSFIAGIIRSIAGFSSRIREEYEAEDDETDYFLGKELVPYENIITNIRHEFQQDFWVDPFQEWLKKDRNIFCDEMYINEGFDLIYKDFFDKTNAEDKKRNAPSADRGGAEAS